MYAKRDVTQMHNEPNILPYFFLNPLKDIPTEAKLSVEDLNLLYKGYHDNCFSLLGAHTFCLPKLELYAIVVRIWRQNAYNVKIKSINTEVYNFKDLAMESIQCHETSLGLFEIAFECILSPVGKIFFDKQIKLKEDSAELPSQKLCNAMVVACNNFIKENVFFYQLSIQQIGISPERQFIVHDSYNFGLLLNKEDLDRFKSGSCWNVDDIMGSHVTSERNIKGVRFSVWAPNAKNVTIVGDWNQWEGNAHPMRKRIEYGVWELFIPDISSGNKYGYRILGQLDNEVIKIDPYAQEFENPPNTASIISSCDDAFKKTETKFCWSDESWIKNREMMGKTKKIFRMPMSIYEVHLPSWIRGDNNTYLKYRDYAKPLIEYLKKMNFTHVEFLPLTHHPFEGSWGYQVSGQYAPYSRLGNPDDLKYLINELHQHNIGVFLDFVLAHFVKDSWGLIYYDTQACYENVDTRESENKSWGTMMFDFRRNEVRSFLLGAAYHWIRRYHIDGLRIDAVSCMIFKNYCRGTSEYVPNEYGGNTDIQAISLLKELNWVVHDQFPGVFMMAEESTSYESVTDRECGLGFDAKWDLGWMNDTLSYLCKPPPDRWHLHHNLTFRSLYFGNERWILPLSHDEVVSGKGSLIDKCGYTNTLFTERLANLRALFGFQIGIPGRPLIFMGCEYAQGREWNSYNSLDWHEAEESSRSNISLWLSDLLDLHKKESALYAGDDQVWNFQWVNCDNRKDNLIAWIRKYESSHNDILVICNFSGLNYHRYLLHVPHVSWITLLNSDDIKYGGSMFGPKKESILETTERNRVGWNSCLWIDIPQFSCLFLKPYIS